MDCLLARDTPLVKFNANPDHSQNLLDCSFGRGHTSGKNVMQIRSLHFK